MSHQPVTHSRLASVCLEQTFQSLSSVSLEVNLLNHATIQKPLNRNVPRAREIAQLIRCLPCSMKTWVELAKTHQKLAMAAPVCSPSVGRDRRSSQPYLAASPNESTHVRFSQRPRSVETTEGRHLTLASDLHKCTTCTYDMHTYTHTHIQIHIYTHTLTYTTHAHNTNMYALTNSSLLGAKGESQKAFYGVIRSKQNIPLGKSKEEESQAMFV